MYFVTGDTHGEFGRLYTLNKNFSLSEEDTIIILGDVGINYMGGERDRELKERLSENFPFKMFCIHGNHERRPEGLGYSTIDWNGGEVYIEHRYPNLLFAKDGEIYDFDGKRCLVLGGAYSIDKGLRLRNNWHWFDDEQPDEKIKSMCEAKLNYVNWDVDIVLSHTAPFRYLPIETFATPLRHVHGLDIDYTTEIWLDTIEDRLTYSRWYLGHYHIESVVDKLRFMFKDIIELE